MLRYIPTPIVGRVESFLKDFFKEVLKSIVHVLRCYMWVSHNILYSPLVIII